MQANLDLRLYNPTSCQPWPRANGNIDVDQATAAGCRGGIQAALALLAENEVSDNSDRIIRLVDHGALA